MTVASIVIVVIKFPFRSVFTDFNKSSFRYNFKVCSGPNPFPISLVLESIRSFSGTNIFVPYSFSPEGTVPSSILSSTTVELSEIS